MNRVEGRVGSRAGPALTIATVAIRLRFPKGTVDTKVFEAQNCRMNIMLGNFSEHIDGATDVLGYAEEFELVRSAAAAICCEAIIETLSPVLMRAEILAYALKEWPKKRYEGWNCPEMFLEIAADLVMREDERKRFEQALAQFFAPPEARRPGSATLGMIRDAGSWDDGSASHYRREYAAQLQLRAIERISPDSVAEFLRTHIELYPMRKSAVERALARGDIAEAKHLAEEGMRQAKKDEYPGHVSHFLDTLMRCAERDGDMQGACEVAIRQFLDFHTEPFSYYRRAKRYAGAQWGDRRAEIIRKLSAGRGRFAHTGKLADVYVEENMWDDLLSFVERNPEMSSSYGRRLEKRYPKEIARVYAEEVQKNMSTPGGRDVYRAQCDTLRTIRRLGCSEIMDMIIKEWREKYPRRRALMEELNRL